MNAIKISVIIPVYNAEQYIRQCLDSVVNQTLTDIEIIIINDASTDSTAVIIKEYQMQYSNIYLIHHEHKVGVSVSRNTGIEKSSGDYLIFLDADDYWDGEQMLNNLYQAATREQVDFVSFGFCSVNDSGVKSRVNVAQSAVIDLHRVRPYINYNIWAKLISRNLIEKYSLRFTSIWGEDALFSICLYCCARRVMIIDEVYYCYRVNPNGMSLSHWDSKKLYGTVEWFKIAIEQILKSELYLNHPDVLQSIIIERLQMLFNKLLPMAFEIFSADELQRYIIAWSRCFSHLDKNNMDVFLQKQVNAPLYREMLKLVSQKNLAGLKTFINTESYRNRAEKVVREVTLLQHQAVNLGRDLLLQNRNFIRCDFGSGVIITLPKEKAVRLAKQLIANQQRSITICFD